MASNPPEPPKPLLPRIAARDASAVAEFLDRYGGLVWSIARRFAPTPSDAEDAVQEIFMRLWRSADRFDPARGSEVAFVALVARNLLIDTLRAAGRQPAAHPGAEGDAISHHATPVTTAERIESAPDVARAVRALARLRPEQRRAIELSVAGGMSHQQVAEATGLPLGTVKTHVRRGLARLRELMLGEDAASADEVRS